MERFQEYLRSQLAMHPSIQPRDVAKLCYQAAFGAEHLLSDTAGVRKHFEQEFAAVPANGKLPLYEQISDGICRMNLGAWKAAGLEAAWLFRMFADTGAADNGSELMEQYLTAAEDVLRSTDHAFTDGEWEAYLFAYKAEGMPAVRHTEQYREAERPAYRIVDTKYLRILPVLLRLQAWRSGIIAVDGRAGAGKSTAAELLRRVLDGGIVYMDDFFLPSELRSTERLAQPGGNVHYERFIEQVLPYLGKNDAFTYKIFDCSRMEFHGQRTVAAGDWQIVEGSYSHHPVFGDYADLRVFVDVDADEQLRRIERRNGTQTLEMFRTRWIPMEEAYFAVHQIAEQADVVM